TPIPEPLAVNLTMQWITRSGGRSAAVTPAGTVIASSKVTLVPPGTLLRLGGSSLMSSGLHPEKGPPVTLKSRLVSPVRIACAIWARERLAVGAAPPVAAA